MKKLKLFLNFDKEEAWLNHMAAEGFLLTNAGFITYTFKEVKPAASVVRIDYQEAMSQADYTDYLSLFADAGWQLLSGSRKGGAQYFAASNADPNADIFSDTESKAQRYKRSIAVWGALAAPFLVFSVVISITAEPGWSLFQSPKDWYLTPGLWDKQGLDFLSSFLFETVFVFFRVGGPFLLVAFTVMCLVIMAYQGTLYRKAGGLQSA